MVEKSALHQAEVPGMSSVFWVRAVKYDTGRPKQAREIGVTACCAFHALVRARERLERAYCWQDMQVRVIDQEKR